jgi:hypothetical protein
VSPVKYELGFYISEDGILHSDRRENLKSYNCNGILLQNLYVRGIIFREHHFEISSAIVNKPSRLS